MLIQDPANLKDEEAAADAKQNVAGPSGAAPPTIPPPSFEESVADQVFQPDVFQPQVINGHFPEADVYVPPGGEEPPPDFTPYEAEFFVSGSAGDIVSHDPHLNADGEHVAV